MKTQNTNKLHLNIGTVVELNDYQLSEIEGGTVGLFVASVAVSFAITDAAFGDPDPVVVNIEVCVMTN